MIKLHAIGNGGQTDRVTILTNHDHDLGRLSIPGEMTHTRAKIKVKGGSKMQVERHGRADGHHRLQ